MLIHEKNSTKTMAIVREAQTAAGGVLWSLGLE